MRKHTWRGSVAILGLLGASLGSQAQAQFAGPSQPPISPYINILRGGAPAAVNYFNIVQPQLQFNEAIGQLQGQQANLGQAITAGSTLGTTTGHPVLFGNYSHYYSRAGIGGGTSGGGYGGMGTSGIGMGMGSMGMGGMGMGMGGMGMGTSGMGMGTSGMGMSGMGMPGR
ncbi:MAG TPA: hypothetical protein VH682_21120 [Gemmataceae bacterium]